MAAEGEIVFRSPIARARPSRSKQRTSGDNGGSSGCYVGWGLCLRRLELPIWQSSERQPPSCLATTTGNSPAFRVSGLDPTGARVKSIHQGREKCLRRIRSVSTTSGHRQARHAWLELSSLMATKCANGKLRKDTVTQQRGTPTGLLTAEHAEITMVHGKAPPGCALQSEIYLMHILISGCLLPFRLMSRST
ncbi:hypothetical protein C8R44DRAFT_744940 [Mycena epipterygia]|nr:hypothetical protein C8R44DRAFT_744940 [Mycena epipterygia]